MSQYVMIGAVVAVALGGLAATCWSIHHTHQRISERNRRLVARVDADLALATRL